MKKEANNNQRQIVIKIPVKKILLVLLALAVWGGSLWAAWQIAARKIRSEPLSFEWAAYPLLNSRLQRFADEPREERLAKTFASLSPLRESLIDYLSQNEQKAAFYIEDLNTGAWAGWNEKEDFLPLSLLKVPVAMGIMKKIDRGEWTLDKTFPLEVKYKTEDFGTLWKEPDNSLVSLKRLIEEMLENSDNTAANLLFDKLTNQERADIYDHIGIANPEEEFQFDPAAPRFKKIKPKDLANIFRALYNATYLTRPSSSFILETLTKTKFDKTAMELPGDVKYAHKIANYLDPAQKELESFHDCGIVYYPQHPYLTCIMTQSSDIDKSIMTITEMNKKIYQFFRSGGKLM